MWPLLKASTISKKKNRPMELLGATVHANLHRKNMEHGETHNKIAGGYVFGVKSILHLTNCI
jgi:hypothetical protein